jgi:hypothetical protein
VRARWTRRIAFGVARAALITAALNACASPAEPGPAQTTEIPLFVGAWRLVSVGGLPLPYSIQESPTRVELIESRITFTASGGFVDTGSRRFTSSDGVIVQQLTEAGTWHSFTKGIVAYQSTLSVGFGVGEVRRDTLFVAGGAPTGRQWSYVRDSP